MIKINESFNNFKVGDKFSTRSLSIPNDNFNFKDRYNIHSEKSYVDDADYTVTEITPTHVYGKYKWAHPDEPPMKIHKSHISYVVRNGKIIYADHQTFNK
jgi:hypothetical protein